MSLIGELAALATSFFLALTALIFTNAGRMIGSQVTNRLRLTFALVYLVILNVILFREPLPFSAESSRWIWLGLSGVIGLSLSNVFFFQSLISVGPRLGSLLLSLAPIFGSIIAWIFFGEILTALQITGIVLALAGIAWVVTFHEEPHGHTRRGVIFGVLAGTRSIVGTCAGRLLIPARSSACRNWCGQHAHGVYKKPSIFLLRSPRNLVPQNSFRRKPRQQILPLGAIRPTGSGGLPFLNPVVCLRGYQQEQ